MENKEYDRRAPDLKTLLNRLEEYSKITWGVNAYELSRAEAELLVQEIKRLSTYQIKVRE